MKKRALIDALQFKELKNNCVLDRIITRNSCFFGCFLIATNF